MSTTHLVMDNARLRAYPYADDAAAEMTRYLANTRDDSRVVNQHLIIKEENRNRMRTMLTDPYGPWVWDGNRQTLSVNSAYFIDLRIDWVGSVSQRSVRKSVAECSNIHGNPGGFPLDNAANFTARYKDGGARGEDLAALALARHADGLPVLNSVMWPKHDRYDFDHVVIAGNRIAILDSKFASIKRPVVLAGADALSVDDIASWREKMNGPRRAKQAEKEAAEARGMKFTGGFVPRMAQWWPNWDGLYVNGVLGSVAPVDGMRHLRKRFEELGMEVEVAVFTGFNSPLDQDPVFEVRGEPVSRVGSVREMAKAAVQWVREAGDEPDPTIVAELHSRLKEGGCISDGCAYALPAAA